MILLLLACASDPAPASPLAAGTAAETPAPAAPAAPAAPVAPSSVPPAPGGEPGSAPAGASEAGTPAAGPEVDTLLGKVPGVAYLGEWTSKGCESRAFARNLRIQEYGTYAAIDLISPCPVGTECAWSGMVGFAGIWKQEGDKLLLREVGAPIAPGSPHPTEITATVDGQLQENGCLYERGLTVPDGYEEERVRPKSPGR